MRASSLPSRYPGTVAPTVAAWARVGQPPGGGGAAFGSPLQQWVAPPLAHTAAQLAQSGATTFGSLLFVRLLGFSFTAIIPDGGRAFQPPTARPEAEPASEPPCERPF